MQKHCAALLIYRMTSTVCRQSIAPQRFAFCDLREQTGRTSLTLLNIEGNGGL
jgi:hypothetical protein